MFEIISTENVNLSVFEKSISYITQSGYQNIGVWNQNEDKPANKHPFEYTISKDFFTYQTPSSIQEDILDVEERLVVAMIFDIINTNFISNRKIISRKLLDLYLLEKEEDPESSGISIGSLRNFYHFLQLYSNIKIPMISLTPDATIYTSWKEHDHLFSINFLSDGEVRFVVFKPNDTNPKRKIRLSGSATTDSIKEFISYKGLCNWILS